MGRGHVLLLEMEQVSTWKTTSAFILENIGGIFCVKIAAFHYLHGPTIFYETTFSKYYVPLYQLPVLEICYSTFWLLRIYFVFCR